MDYLIFYLLSGIITAWAFNYVANYESAPIAVRWLVLIGLVWPLVTVIILSASIITIAKAIRRGW
jgi:hypothetical protein